MKTIKTFLTVLAWLATIFAIIFFGFFYFSSLDDTQSCEKIKVADDKNECLATVKLDVTYCSNITDDNQREDCYYFIAVQKKDPSLCPSDDDIVEGRCMESISSGTTIPLDKSFFEKIKNWYVR